MQIVCDIAEFSMFYSKMVPREDQGGERRRSGVRSVTSNFRYTNVNGVSVDRFSAEKSIRDFCHQGKGLKSQNFKP